MRVWRSSGTSAHMRKVEAEELMGQAEREQRKPGKMSVMEEKNMTNCQEQRGLKRPEQKAFLRL